MKKHRLKFFQSDLLKKVLYSIVILFFAFYVIVILISAFKDGNQDINYSGLDAKVNTDTNIYIDGIKIGVGKADESFLFSKISPGNKKLKVINQKNDSLYYERVLVFEKGTVVTLDLNFGVNNETSSGLVKYFIKKINDKSRIRIISTIPKSIIEIDNQISSDGIITADSADHTIVVSKEGYLSKNFTISLYGDAKFNTTDNSKKRFLDYDLVVEVTLFQLPFE